MIIGLTGGIASGKTTVANLFIALGIDVVDADIVAREVVEPGTDTLQEIANHFGDTVLQDDGGLDRSALRTIIFSDVNQKNWLNDLLHPLIRHTIIEQLQATTSPYSILVAPLLLENNMQTLVSRVLVVDAHEQNQIERTIKRDNNNEAQTKSIISAQIPRLKRLALADDVIKNNGMINNLTNDVKKLHDEYLHVLRKEPDTY